MHRTSLLAAVAVAAALQGVTGAQASVRHPVQLAQAATPLPIPQGQADTSVTPAPAAPAPAAGAETAPAPAAPKDQSQVPKGNEAPTGAAPQPPEAEKTPPVQPDTQAAPGESDGEAAPDSQAVPDDQAQPDDGGEGPPDLSLGEIPVVEVMELTPDIAKRALDSYLAAKEKYSDAGLDQFENLQDFVDQTEEGKKFEADVKAAGFANVTEWNLAITSLTVMYGSVLDNQDADLEDQIKEVEADSELAQDMKDRMIKSIRAMIPSANNRKIVEDLMADPVYGDKLKQLDTGGEEE